MKKKKGSHNKYEWSNTLQSIRSLYKLCIFLLIQKIYTNIIVIKSKHGIEMYRTSGSSFPSVTSVHPDRPGSKTLLKI